MTEDEIEAIVERTLARQHAKLVAELPKVVATAAEKSDRNIEHVVRSTLDQQSDKMEDREDAVVLRAVAGILVSFGIDEQDRLAFKDDMSFLRRMRLRVEGGTTRFSQAVITLFVSGIAWLLYYGVTAVFHRGD